MDGRLSDNKLIGMNLTKVKKKVAEIQYVICSLAKPKSKFVSVLYSVSCYTRHGTMDGGLKDGNEAVCTYLHRLSRDIKTGQCGEPASSTGRHSMDLQMQHKNPTSPE